MKTLGTLLVSLAVVVATVIFAKAVMLSIEAASVRDGVLGLRSLKAGMEAIGACLVSICTGVYVLVIRDLIRRR